MDFEPIAVVGRGCILPGASSPEQLWENILARKVSLGPVPEGRWRLSRDWALGTPENATDRTWSDIGGYAPDLSAEGVAEEFARFGHRLPEVDTADLDPLFSWTVHGVGAALREAGQERLLARTGLVMGNLSYPSTGLASYAEQVWQGSEGRRPHPYNRFFSGLPAHLAARAFGLGLGGMALGAACASSLYAVALACNQLRDRQADLMVAGGVNGVDDLFLHVSFCSLSAMSRTGRSRPFQQGADGLVPAEGAAFVALMRLSDAIAADARILGVIRGVGLSNDGRGQGLLVPSEEGQRRAMEQAYRVAGVAPESVGLLECHATGTVVGDRVEARSSGRIFADAADLPMGSVKSNLGHAITAAGASGLLKLLAALDSGVRPATLGIDEPLAELSGTPLRPVREAEEWAGPRRGAVSAFGFGGNNAHLIVDAWTGDSTGAVAPPVRPTPPPPDPAPPVAVVAVGARVADGMGTDDLSRSLMRGTPRSGRRSFVEVELDGLRFPPLDLHDTLAQQLLVLEAAREAAAMTTLPRERTMVLVGMGCDPETARHIARWRVPEWLLAPGEAATDPARTTELRDAVRPAQTAAAVIGAMPNVVANRINSQLDLTGPGFVVSAEEASGVAALETGARALRAGEADAVLVGAVDLSCEPVHRAALADVGRDTEPGDAAVVLVLKRLDDARAAGDTVLAVLDGDGGGPVGFTVGDQVPDADGATGERFDPCGLYGRAHAASGLLSVAVAALALHHRARPRAGSVAVPALDDAPAAATCVPLGGSPTRTRLCAGDVAPFVDEALPRLYVYSGRDRAEVLSALAAGRESDEGPARLVLCAADAAEHTDLAERARQWLLGRGVRPADAAFQERPVEGQIAFVYSGGSMAYRGMGRELVLAFPELLDSVRERSGDLRSILGWAFATEDSGPPHPLDQIGGASVLGQLHTRITQDVLGLRPQAALGYSSGESVSLAALGAWPDVSPLLTQARGSQLFTHWVAGDLQVPRRAWRRLGLENGEWASHVAETSPERVRAALAGEPAAHLMVVNAPDSCVFGGLAEACERVLKRLTNVLTLPVDYQIAAHVPEVEEVRREWWNLHHLPTHPVPGVRFYTCASGDWYHPTAETAADAVTAQGLGSIDFARTIERAWDDGARIFIEHGPRSRCSGWIDRTLGSRGHLAVALDAPEGRGIRRLFHVAAELTAAGVRVDSDALYARLATGRRAAPAAQRLLTLPAHPPELRLPRPVPYPVVTYPAPDRPLPAKTKAAAPDHPLPGTMTTPAPALPLPGKPMAAAPALPLPGKPMAAAPALPLPGKPMAAAPALPLPGKPMAAAPPTPAADVPGAPEAVPRPVLPVGPAPRPAVSGPVTPRDFRPAGPDLMAVVTAHAARVARGHRQFLTTQADIHTRFLASQQWAAELAARAGTAPPPPASVPWAASQTDMAVAAPAAPAPEAPPAAPPTSAPGGPHVPAVPATPAVPAVPVAPAVPAVPAAPAVPAVPAAPAGQDRAPADRRRKPTGPSFTRAELERLAVGPVSEFFGPMFAPQDRYARQTRLPAPPMLLVDRVTGIDAEPGSMGTGTLWTETDIRLDSWYLDSSGRIPAGIMVEAGQADLLLISWLGVDLLNRGERVYRLLGCELTFHGSPPGPDETLRYEIHIDGHGEHGGVRIFFFHYDAYLGDELRLSMREGQAGFFTAEELADTGGVLWKPEDTPPDPARPADPPVVPGAARSFGPELVRAFAEGHPADCFGPGWELTRSHIRSPRIGDGRLRLLHSVPVYDPAGGPWGRGYLRAETPISPDDWFFEGHFTNDPCMPGTLMFDGCLQAMSFYLAAAGFTLDRDGWRFEPVSGVPYTMLCRGQVTPESRLLTYEVFVSELSAGPEPVLVADVLCTVDGVRAFHARGVGVRLVPDWPLTHWRRLGPPAVQADGAPVPHRALAGLTGHRESAVVAEVDGFRYDYAAMLACAWGRPSEAFGPAYAPFDSTRRLARLPGPPFHFMSRVVGVEGTPWVMEAGAAVEVEYEVPEEVWYFEQNDFAGAMPFSVLMEVVLQASGWLASYVGSALTSDSDLLFRNLDGTGTVHREVRPGMGVLHTRTRLREVSRSAEMIIQAFDVECVCAGEPVFSLTTVFGFFPPSAFDNQVGLPPSEEESALLSADCAFGVELTARPEKYFADTLCLPRPMLLMLDRVTGYWPDAGRAGLGRLRAVKDVDPGDWFFQAHFFQDPVQPGSLGVQAMCQLLQFYAIENGLGAGFPAPRFEPVLTGQAVTWKYRGQVTPRTGRVTVEVEIREVVADEHRVRVIGEGWLWADGTRIYHVQGLGIGITPGTMSTH